MKNFTHMKALVNGSKIFLFAFLSVFLLTNQVQSQKHVVLEELTGTWCSWCPRGMYYADSLINQYDEVIFIAIHSADVMSYDEYASATGIQAAPTALVNRSGEAASPQNWFQLVQNQLLVENNVNISVTNNYNESTRVLEATVSVNVLNNISGDFRIGGVVVEDGVTGPSPSYNQSNSYAGGANGAMGGYENMPNPIPANRIAYDHVARYLFGGYEGQESSFPSSANAGDTYSYTFSYVVPEEIDPNYVRVVGWLIDQSNNYIENAAKSLYLNGSNNAAPLFTSTERTDAYVNINYLYNMYFHDTDDENIVATAVTLPDWLTFEQYNDKSAAIYGMPTQPGSYDVIIQITDGESTTNQEFTIIVNEQLDGEWQLLGDRGFSNSCYVYDMSIADDGTVYAILSESSTLGVYKNAQDEEGWIKMGGSPEMTDGAIEVSPQGDIYIIYNDAQSALKIQRWDGSNWADVGNFTELGVQMDLVIDSEENLYIVYMDMVDYNGKAMKYSNGSWSPVGTGSFTSQVGTWYEMAIGNDDTPYILWCDYNNSFGVNVSYFDGSQWNVLGGGAMASVGSYYYQKIQIADDGTVYVAYSTYGDNFLQAYKFTDGTWQTLGDNISGGATSYVDLALKSDGTPVIAYCDVANGGYISCVEYADGWSNIGQIAFSQGIGTQAEIDVWNDTPYIVYRDADMDNKATCEFYFMQNILYPPTNLNASLIEDYTVLLTWDAPENQQPLSYNIYRNDALVGNVTELTYTDENVPVGDQIYTLTAVYEDGESPAAGPVSVTVVVGIADLETEQVFKCYPTLIESNFTIEAKVPGQISIYSINNMPVEKIAIENTVETIDLSFLKSGVYIVVFQSENIKVVRKIVKN